MPGLLSYSYDDLKSGKIKLREDGTMIPPEDSGAVIITRLSKILVDGGTVTWTDSDKEKILSCFPKSASSHGTVNRRNWVKDLIIHLNRMTTATNLNNLVFRVYEIRRTMPAGPTVIWMLSSDQKWKFSISITGKNEVSDTSTINANTSEVLSGQYNTFIYSASRYSGHYEDPLGRYNFKEQYQLSTTVTQTSSTPNATGNAIMNNLIKSNKLMAFAMQLENTDDIEFKIFTLSRYLWLASVTERPTPHEWVFETADKNQMLVIRVSNSEILWAAFIDKTVT